MGVDGLPLGTAPGTEKAPGPGTATAPGCWDDPPIALRTGVDLPVGAAPETATAPGPGTATAPGLVDPTPEVRSGDDLVTTETPPGPAMVPVMGEFPRLPVEVFHEGVEDNVGAGCPPCLSDGGEFPADPVGREPLVDGGAIEDTMRGGDHEAW